MDTAMKVQQKMVKPGIIAPLSILQNMFYGLIISLIIGIFVKKQGNPLIDSDDVR
jgi:hypothetical protein